MIASAVLQTILLLSSGAVNVLISPGTLSVEKQLFVSSVILIVGFAQGVVLLLLKVIVRTLTGWNMRFGSSYLFAPLTTAMSNAVNDRPGETDVTTPVVIRTPVITRNHVRAVDAGFDGFESDDDSNTGASHFMPELEIAIAERRNIYTDIYLLGVAAFTATYCIDTVSPAPTTAFLSGLLIMSIAQSCHIMVILMRTSGTQESGSLINGRRILTVTSCGFATASFIMFSLGLVEANIDSASIDTVFDLTFSILLPLVSPWLLVLVSPKQQPMRTLLECTPFVFTICVSFVLFFIATRGEIYTILHELDVSGGNVTFPQGDGAQGDGGNEFEIHSNVNASIHFELDFFSKTSVESAGNIPLLLCAPIIKIPTMVVVLANIMNRSNLVVVTALLVIMSFREVATSPASEACHRAYAVAFTLGIVSLGFNVIKYLHTPIWMNSLYASLQKKDAVEPVVVKDVVIDQHN